MRLLWWLPVAALAALLAGCTAGAPPADAPGAPPSLVGRSTESLPQTSAYVIGAADSVTPVPGSPASKYRVRFRMVEPGSDRFNFQDDDLSFAFRPTPGALHIMIENKQNFPVSIDWDRSIFHAPLGSTGKVANANSRWQQRFNAQPPSMINPLGRYSDYMFPMDYLIDPAGIGQQLHRPLIPEDDSAPSFTDRDFGVSLVMRIDQEPRTYNFRFKVVSVLPR